MGVPENKTEIMTGPYLELPRIPKKGVCNQFGNQKKIAKSNEAGLWDNQYDNDRFYT